MRTYYDDDGEEASSWSHEGHAAERQCMHTAGTLPLHAVRCTRWRQLPRSPTVPALICWLTCPRVVWPAVLQVTEMVWEDEVPAGEQATTAAAVPSCNGAAPMETEGAGGAGGAAEAAPAEGRELAKTRSGSPAKAASSAKGSGLSGPTGPQKASVTLELYPDRMDRPFGWQRTCIDWDHRIEHLVVGFIAEALLPTSTAPRLKPPSAWDCRVGPRDPAGPRAPAVQRPAAGPPRSLARCAVALHMCPAAHRITVRELSRR